MFGQENVNRKPQERRVMPHTRLKKVEKAIRG
jgi:hypothetical protein